MDQNGCNVPIPIAILIAVMGKLLIKNHMEESILLRIDRIVLTSAIEISTIACGLLILSKPKGPI